MVFHVKNAHTHKKVVPTAIVFLMTFFIISLFLVQMPLVSAQEGAASLTGKIYDNAVNVDEDEFSDSLDIGVEVNVTTAGTFKVEVSGLYDSKSNTINVSNQNSTSLEAGTQIVYVSLDGASIFESWLSPVNVSRISLYDESDTLLDSKSDIRLSRTFHFGEFGLLPARLTKTIYDEGVDTDGDGYYNYLNLGVEVNVTTAGTYTVDAGGLYEPTPNYVSVQTKNTTYLGVGIHVVYLALDGTEIYAASVNPTKIAGILLYDETNTTLSEVHDLSLSTTYTYDQFQRPVIEIEFSEVEREIILDQAGSIRVVNAYRITNLGFRAEAVVISFPEDAYDLEVRDEMGTLTKSTENNTLTVTLRSTLETNETETLYLIYNIPWSSHINQKDGNDYGLSFTFYEQFNSTIGKLTVSVTLPKGAKFQSATPLDPVTVKESSLQETVNFAFSDVTPSNNLDFEINYEYNVFWGSFYPTIWVGILAIAASAVFLVWGTPKTISAPTIHVPPKDLRSFVDAYEEKIKIRSELESLEERLRKGKIPRRRFKVRKKMLDSRLSNVSRTLSSLRENIRAAGPQYASMMRQIEVAETTLEGTERDLQRVKNRYRRGEISKGAYMKLVEEYNGRIEDAEATIDGVLLRLHE
ncbi:MAG TPA: hypothetical protein ENN36_04235 [Candidatus Bathyarchaeota archaeon]|nr:hypothetical protein [Candidatus Bathyarchaeota archaeon]